MKNYWGCLRIFICVFCLALFTASLAVKAQDAQFETMTHDGKERVYYVHAPETADDVDAMALLIVLHPTASSGRTMEALTGFDDAADENGFVVVYPNSYGLTWNEGRAEVETELDDGSLADDVGFLQALIERLAEIYPIDMDNIHLTGLGSGGLMVYRMACETPALFQTATVVGSLMWDHHRQICPEEAEAPINMLVMHGLADPFYGVDTHMATNVFSPDSGPLVLGIDDTLTYWATRNGCVDEPVVTAPIVRFPDCPEGGDVSYYGLVNGATIWYRNGDYKLNQTGVDVSEKVVQFMQGDEGWMETPNADPIAIARSFIVYTPTTYNESQSAPVVIALHGRYGNGAGMASLIDFNRIAEEHGVIAVYPDGIDNEWNYVRGIMGYEQKPYDDTKFLADLVDDLAVDLNIDMSRIYALGFSNGGFMAQRLACDNPERYAGFASVAATGFLGMQTVCRSPVPVNMAFINGTEDNNVSWTGYRQIQGQNVPTNLSVNETFGFWADWDQCEGAGTTEDLPQLGNSPETSVRTLTLDDCADGVTLKLFGVIGGGHNWPGVPDAIITEVAGNVNLDIQASDAIWAFWSGEDGMGSDEG